MLELLRITPSSRWQVPASGGEYGVYCRAMVKADDMLAVAAALDAVPVQADEARCIAVRNRHASCERCMDACPVGAILVWENRVEADAETCVGCGACVSACPTGALSLREVPAGRMSTLAASAARACSAGGWAGEHTALAMCSQLVAKSGVPARAVRDCRIEPACLAAVTVEDVLEACAEGVDRIVLASADCASCPWGEAASTIETAVREANALLEVCSVAARVEWVTGIPRACVSCGSESGFDTGRRRFFGDMKDAALHVAKTAVEQEISSRVDADAPTRDLSFSQRFRVNAEGAMPRIAPTRVYRILDAMDRLGASSKAALVPSEAAASAASTARAAEAALGSIAAPGEASARADDALGSAAAPAASVVAMSRCLGRVELRRGECTACGMCATFCPTGALRRVESDAETVGSAADRAQTGSTRKTFANLHRTAQPSLSLEFSAAECTGCSLCADVCPVRCLTVEHAIPLRELFSFEPRVVL